MVDGEETTSGLKRGLELAQSAALLFAVVGASGGVYSLWTFSHGTVRPAFSGRIRQLGRVCRSSAGAGRALVPSSLCRKPLRVAPAASRRSIRRACRVVNGWLYLCGMIVTVTLIYPAIANTALALFGFTSSTHLVTELSVLFLFMSFIVNALNIGKVGRLGVLGVAGESSRSE